MKTVWKYLIRLEDRYSVLMPQGAEVLHVATQGNAPFMWARVDPEAPLESRWFDVAGTGHPLSATNSAKHLGSFMYAGGLVFHVFEGLGGDTC